MRWNIKRNHSKLNLYNKDRYDKMKTFIELEIEEKHYVRYMLTWNWRYDALAL